MVCKKGEQNEREPWQIGFGNVTVEKSLWKDKRILLWKFL